MVVNVLPELLPYVNIGASLMGVSLTIILFHLWHRKLVVSAMLAAALVNLAGALFQANLLPIDLWIIIGTGGRFAYFTFVFLIVYVITRNRE